MWQICHPTSLIVAQLGPPSLPTPGILVTNLCPEVATTFLTRANVIPCNGIFMRRDHGDFWPAISPTSTYMNRAAGGPCTKGPLNFDRLPFVPVTANIEKSKVRSPPIDRCMNNV